MDPKETRWLASERVAKTWEVPPPFHFILQWINLAEVRAANDMRTAN